jgi:hypothetical protein
MLKRKRSQALRKQAVKELIACMIGWLKSVFLKFLEFFFIFQARLCYFRVDRACVQTFLGKNFWVEPIF